MSNQLSANETLPLDKAAAIVPLGQLRAQSAPAAGWLWDGYLAPGKVTLLTSLWKAGKTTLLSVLLAKMRAGGELAGRPVHPARPVVVTEESPDYWAERSRRLDLASDIGIVCQPFLAKPTPDQWQALIDTVMGAVNETGVNVLVIDPLATFLPGLNENSAGAMLAGLLPLQSLTRIGVAVLLLHHPRKTDYGEELSPRGSGALTGHADILLQLRRYPHATESDRRRRLCGLSRFAATSHQVVIELNCEETDYACLGDLEDEAFRCNWEVLRTVMLPADGPLTRNQILSAWPVVELAPGEATLWRWLERAVAEGKVQRLGTGRAHSPFRYWLPEAKAAWKRQSLPPLDFYTDIDLNETAEERANPILPPSLRGEGKAGK